MRAALALPLAVIGCAPAIEAGTPLNELPILEGTEACDGIFNDDGAPFLCRQIPIDRADAIAEYQNILRAQGWLIAERNDRESLFPSGLHGRPDALWLERPITPKCSELTSVHFAPIETRDDGLRVGMFILSGYEQVCDGDRGVR